MPTRFLFHTTFLILVTIAIYFWLSIPALLPYTLQLVALLVLLYVGSHAIKKRIASLQNKSSITLDVTILTAMILLLVTETGALTSPFFFLLYFLLFGVAMLYEIEATLVLTGVLILFFLFIPGTSLADFAHLSQLIALVMITPLAIFTGHQYETSLDEKRSKEILNSHIAKEETDTLIFLSLNLKKTLLSALDTLSLVIPQERAKEVRSHLETLYTDLRVLYRSAGELEDTIDKQTD